MFCYDSKKIFLTFKFQKNEKHYPYLYFSYNDIHLFSCKVNNDSFSQSLLAEKLSQNSTFIELEKMKTQIFQRRIDYVIGISDEERKVVDISIMENLYSTIGFESPNEFKEYIENVQIPLLDKLFSELPELKESDDFLNIMHMAKKKLAYKFKYDFGIVEANSGMSRADCQGDYIACNNSAYAAYDLSSTSCVGGYAGGGSSSSYAECLTGSINNYLFDSGVCDDAFAAC